MAHLASKNLSVDDAREMQLSLKQTNVLPINVGRFMNLRV